MEDRQEPLMRLQDINMTFRWRSAPLTERKFHVLKNVNLDIYEGEILALVGESGCGKTTLGKIITGLYKPTSGEIIVDSERLNGTSDKRARNNVQLIQQDSYAALNPVRTIYQSLYAPLKKKHRKWSKKQIDDKLEELMEEVGLQPADQFLSKYPHQLSGGQRQRILMARAISLEPKIIVADEPVSMVDVSMRLSLLNLMRSLNQRHHMSFLYISHDLSTTRYITQNGRVCVMYLGEIVEMGRINEVIEHPRHPYTRALIQAVPVPDPDYVSDDNLPLKSMWLASTEYRPEGCSFFERCPYASGDCLVHVDYADTPTAKVLCNHLDAVPNKPVFTIRADQRDAGERAEN